jgi:hypothetical protein
LAPDGLAVLGAERCGICDPAGDLPARDYYVD